MENRTIDTFQNHAQAINKLRESNTKIEMLETRLNELHDFAHKEEITQLDKISRLFKNDTKN